MKLPALLALALLSLAPLAPTAAASNTCGDTLLFLEGTPTFSDVGQVTITATFHDDGAHCGLYHWAFTFYRDGEFFSGPWGLLGSYTVSNGNYVITADINIDDAATWTVFVEAGEECCNPAGVRNYATGTWTLVSGREPTACEDGVDNDGDGTTDLSDPGCAGASDTSERGTTTCDDGADNDGDGTFDSPDDPGCLGPADSDELGTTACDNGMDDDGDGYTDAPDDLGCTGPGDGSETNDCPETAPLVQVCIAKGGEASPPVQLVEVGEGAGHTVVGYLDVYRFGSPPAGPVQAFCVTLLIDGTEVNPCDEVGTFVSRSGTLVNREVAEPTVEDAGLPEGVHVCHAEFTILVAQVGLPAFQGYTLC